MGKSFLNMAINRIGPVKLLVRKGREVRLFCVEADGSMPHLDEVQDEALDSFKMAFPWGNPEARHCHDGSGDVDPPQRHGPLESTNE